MRGFWAPDKVCAACRMGDLTLLSAGSNSLFGRINSEIEQISSLIDILARVSP